MRNERIESRSQNPEARRRAFILTPDSWPLNS
jgi:hypothetical protein